MVPSARVTHCWAALPLQSNSCAGVAFAVPASRASRHLPNACSVRSPGADQRCASLALQPNSCSGVPEVGSASATSAQSPAGPAIGPGGNRHVWPAAPAQSVIWACAVPEADRQRPDATWVSVPSDCRVHDWAAAPLHDTIATGLPAPVPAGARQRPSTRTVPSPPYVTCWAAVWLQAYSCTGWPSAATPPRTSRHCPPAPITSPAARFPAADPSSATVCAAVTGSASVVTVTTRRSALYDQAVSGTCTPSTVTAAGAPAFDNRSVY